MSIVQDELDKLPVGIAVETLELVPTNEEMVAEINKFVDLEFVNVKVEHIKRQQI